MKKVLSILLVIALSVTLFAGCGEKPSSNPDSSADPTPTPTSDTMRRPTYSNQLDDVIRFNLYDEADFMTRWTDVSREWMLNNYHLAINNSIPNVWTGDTLNLSDADTRKTYNTAFSQLFQTQDTYPDYMPALHANAAGLDACFKDLFDHLVDLNPYIEEGQILHGYVSWVWAGAEDYWESAKKVFESDGALYALPRREMMPTQTYLCYAEKQLNDINYQFDNLPTTWDGFVDMLRAFKNVSSDNVPFTQDGARLDTLLKFIATTYGLDFNLDFSWTTKNGEPLWTYYWDEYLQILQRANELAAEGLVYTDSVETKRVVHYDMNDTASGRKYALRNYKNNAQIGLSIASYTTSAEAAMWSSDIREVTLWRVSPVMVSQEGKEYSVIASSQIDTTWFAIGNRLGEEFALRICDMLAYSASDEGYIRYFFGKEGDPFEDSVEDAGNFIWVYDEDSGEKRMRFTVEDRFGGTSADPDFWNAIDPHYSLFPDGVDWGMNWDSAGNLADKYGVTDTGFYPSWRNYKLGTIFYADITSYPMQMTVYWEKQEAMGKYDMKSIEAVKGEAEANNTIIYNGFYKTPKEALGGAESKDIETKISTIASIAKQFTIDFLSGKKTATHWDSYIKDLKAAGYDDVYEFYKATAYSFPTQTVSGTESQSSVNAKR